MKYFTTRNENVALTDLVRKSVRGDFVSTWSGTTHVELRGPDGGDVVLLVGGLTIPLYYWSEFAEQLHNNGFRTVSYSAYGRGYSDRVRTAYDEQLFVDQISDLCATLGVTPKHIVGSSMGALISMNYLHQHPGGIDSLSIVGPAGMEPALPAPARLLNSGPSDLFWAGVSVASTSIVIWDRMFES